MGPPVGGPQFPGRDPARDNRIDGDHSCSRANLARSSAHEAPTEIAFAQVLEHALRHLAWLAKEDDVVKETLIPAWHEELAGYVPAPFEQLD